jgi:hypothetical protein
MSSYVLLVLVNRLCANEYSQMHHALPYSYRINSLCIDLADRHPTRNILERSDFHFVCPEKRDTTAIRRTGFTHEVGPNLLEYNRCQQEGYVVTP